MGTRIASLRTKEVPCTFAHHRWFFGHVSAGEEVWSFSPVVAGGVVKTCLRIHLIFALFSHAFRIVFSSLSHLPNIVDS